MPMNDRSSRQSSPDLVVNAIKQGVLRGRFVPGQRLIEADLTREIGVSRGPVREALKLLAAEGIVVLSPHRGAYIRALSRTEAEHLIEVLEVIMGFAVRRAAERIDEGNNRTEMLAAFKQLERHGPHGDRALLAVDRAAFYGTIFRITGNGELSRLNPVIPTQILRLQVHSHLTGREREEQFSDYALLLEAILAGDGKRAQKILERHLQRTRTHAQALPAETLLANLGEASPGAPADSAEALDAATSDQRAPRRRRGAGQRPSP